MVRSIPPSVTPPSPFEWPETVHTITLISRNNTTTVTSPSHGLTSADQQVTYVGFKQVKGMTQINGLNALVQQVIDANNFTVNINSTNFTNYASSGVFIIDSGIPPIETQGFQTFNTPFHNIA